MSCCLQPRRSDILWAGGVRFRAGRRSDNRDARVHAQRRPARCLLACQVARAWASLLPAPACPQCTSEAGIGGTTAPRLDVGHRAMALQALCVRRLLQGSAVVCSLAKMVNTGSRASNPPYPSEGFQGFSPRAPACKWVPSQVEIDDRVNGEPLGEVVSERPPLRHIREVPPGSRHAQNLWGIMRVILHGGTFLAGRAVGHIGA